MNAIKLRPASADDLAAINEIYNHYVLTSTCTMQLEPSTPEERAAWFAAHGPGYPVLVAELDGQIAAWGSLSPYHARPGYRHTSEDSIYVRAGLHGRGLGRALLTALIDAARAANHHVVLAKVSAEQASSIQLHKSAGFIEVGRLREVGRMFERWSDVLFRDTLLCTKTDRVAVQTPRPGAGVVNGMPQCCQDFAPAQASRLSSRWAYCTSDSRPRKCSRTRSRAATPSRGPRVGSSKRR
jgi:L-amino acid N-acyltransferase YncA